MKWYNLSYYRGTDNSFSMYSYVIQQLHMSYFRYLCFFAHSGVQDILRCVPYMASISGLSIFIASSVFSNIYLKKISIKSRRPMLLVKEIWVNRENTVSPSVRNMTDVITSRYFAFGSYCLVFTAFLKYSNVNKAEKQT
jgi:hypothetical protein